MATLNQIGHRLTCEKCKQSFRCYRADEVLCGPCKGRK